MHRVAEEGIAAHWKYKEGRVGDGPRRAVFTWLRQLLEWQQEVRDPQEFIQNLQGRTVSRGGLHLHAEGRGEVASRGARRRVDFAYAMHTEVGPPVRRRPGQRPDGPARERGCGTATSSRS